MLHLGFVERVLVDGLSRGLDGTCARTLGCLHFSCRGGDFGARSRAETQFDCLAGAKGDHVVFGGLLAVRVCDLDSGTKTGVRLVFHFFCNLKLLLSCR